MLLRSSHGQKRGIIWRIFAPVRYIQKAIDYTRDGYAAVVKVLVRKAVLGLVALAAVVFGVGYLTKITPTGFLPSEDQGAFFIEIQLPEGSSVNRTTRTTEKVEAILAQQAGISDITSIIGYSFLDGISKSNSSFIVVLLKSFEERADPSLSADALIAKVRGEFGAISEANVIAFNLPPIIGLGTGSGFEYQLQDLQGGSPVDLAGTARGMMFAANQDPALHGCLHHLFGEYAPALSRYRPRQGADPGNRR